MEGSVGLRAEESAWLHSFREDSLNTKTTITDQLEMVRKSTCIEHLATAEGIVAGVELLKLAV